MGWILHLTGWMGLPVHRPFMSDTTDTDEEVKTISHSNNGKLNIIIYYNYET
jgi:hypothetical protein